MLVWVGVAVAIWAALLTAVAVFVLRPSTAREQAERDVYTQFERATGRQL